MEHAHERLVELAPAVTARFADTFGLATGEARVSRIHGDYHLGQLLARTDGGFSVIDFEGEPARPLAERRLPGSPLRDVAGMLRSLDYAARTAARDAPAFDADDWLAGAREAFIGAYGGISPPRPACSRRSSSRRRATRSATRRATGPTGCGCRSRRSSGSPSLIDEYPADVRMNLRTRPREW